MPVQNGQRRIHANRPGPPVIIPQHRNRRRFSRRDARHVRAQLSAVFYLDAGIATAAGSDSAGLPNTVNSMMPSGVVCGQLTIVKRTNRHFVGGISSKMVLRTASFLLWSSTVVNSFPSLEVSTLY